MKNHDEKTKDMIESVLPSTARKGSRRRRRQIHKAQRARQRDALGKFDAAADPDDFDPDFWQERRLRDTVEMVADRRAADKIGPIARWAIATIDADPELREAPLREQIDYFAAMLPADLSVAMPSRTSSGPSAPTPEGATGATGVPRRKSVVSASTKRSSNTRGVSSLPESTAH